MKKQVRILTSEEKASFANETLSCDCGRPFQFEWNGDYFCEVCLTPQLKENLESRELCDICANENFPYPEIPDVDIIFGEKGYCEQCAEALLALDEHGEYKYREERRKIVIVKTENANLGLEAGQEFPNTDAMMASAWDFFETEQYREFSRLFEENVSWTRWDEDTIITTACWPAGGVADGSIALDATKLKQKAWECWSEKERISDQFNEAYALVEFNEE